MKYYLKIALRNLVKHKSLTFINITGLATGIACSILILLFVVNELSYDKFHQYSDRIYRLAVRAMIGDTKINQTFSSAETFRKLCQDFPEIEKGVKFLRLGQIPVILGDKTFYESKFYAVDAPFFEIFTIPLIKGNPSTVLTEPNSLVLSENTARKYFGSTDVIGRLLKVNSDREKKIYIFKITGVSENVPDNSHFHFDSLISSATFPDLINNKGWSANNFITYLLLKKGTSETVFNEKLKEFTRKYMGMERFDAWVAKGNYWEYFLQPMTDIHLNSDLNGEFEPNGNKTYVYVFLLIAIIIILIACINFMNLSTAKSSLRAKEVGMRKVMGSSRKRLISQFLSESFILSYISLVIGLIMVHLLLPVFQNLFGRQLELHYFNNPLVIPSLLALGFLVGLISGSYPSFFLSSLKPVSILKDNTGSSKGNPWLRNILVITQFSISIILIIGTLAVSKQLHFLSNKKLGFEKEHILVIRNPGTLAENREPFKQTLRNQTGIVDVSGSSTLPGQGFRNIGFRAEGVDKSFTLNLCVCDHDFLKTMKMQIARGRFFSRDFGTDAQAVVLNEKAVKLLGWQDPLGKKINDGSEGSPDFKVIGVIKDYHYESLHQEIRPQALFLSGKYNQDTQRNISVRLKTANLSETIGFIKNTWNKLTNGKPFEYSFLDNDYDNLYRNEKQTKQLFSIFSFLAIFIGCLGLFGLASFIADGKTKEIGIRKVLGASVMSVVGHLNKSFVKWIILANLIAWPAAQFLMNNWLNNFAYRTDLSWWMFPLTSLLVLFVAIATVSLQTVKSALKNPINSLRNE